MPSFGGNNPQAYLGSWKTWNKFWGYHNGSWKRPISVFVKRSGSWVKVYDEAPRVTNVFTSVQPDFDSGGWFNTKNFTVSANGFLTSITVDGSSAGTVAIDTIQSRQFTKFSFSFGDFPSITVANSAGSVTF